MRRAASLFAALLIVLPAFVHAEELKFKERALQQLVEIVPDILKTYDAGSGRFGTGLFTVREQNVLFPLAVAYATQSEKNPYYKDAKLLDVIMKGGDALIGVQDAEGKWRYDKKDASYWGQTYMPWTYSRWIRAYDLIKEEMPPERRARWEAGLTKGYEGISKSALERVHNIPTHHAMALYIAGKALGRPEWQEQAAEFMQKVVAAQQEGGYWSENAGPVVGYGYVYVEALGIYYAVSGDERVLPALKKSAAFHRQFTYPDGSGVAVVDQRNPYHAGIGDGAMNVGFTMTPEGRAQVAGLWRHNGGDLKLMEAIDGSEPPYLVPNDIAALYVQYGMEGEMAEQPREGTQALVEGGEPRALTLAKGPWFAAISAYTAESPDSRWIQDRQNFVSLFRDGVGVFAGGGNTRMQPGWSTFTVGDVGLLKHTPGDEEPDFKPKGELYHVPSSSLLTPGDEPRLALGYGPTSATLQVRPVSEARLEIDYSATGQTDLPVLAHLPLMAEMGAALETGGGYSGKLGEEPIELDAAKMGGKLIYRGLTFELPAGTTLHWPALPHNPYRKDGRALPKEGRIELRISLKPDGTVATVGIQGGAGDKR